MTVRSEHGLGRGLAALIQQRATTDGEGGSVVIALARIVENPNQPRRRFDEAELETLVASIREHGVIQPVLVTELLDGYRLVAGERRVRAARIAGLERIPAIVRQLSERQQLELALVENLQREDLNAVETAGGYRRLIEEFGLTQEELAERVGRARSTIANTLRLLDLAPALQQAIVDRRTTEGHARAIGSLPLAHQERVLARVVADQLSVRQAEELVRRLREPRPALVAPDAPPPADADLQHVEEELRRALGTKVSLARGRRGGRIVIEYYSDEELSRLYERLTGGAG